MGSATVVEQAVVRATQSPMNAGCWLAELQCGHELWLNRARRPTGMQACSECTRDQLDDEEREVLLWPSKRLPRRLHDARRRLHRRGLMQFDDSMRLTPAGEELRARTQGKEGSSDGE